MKQEESTLLAFLVDFKESEACSEDTLDISLLLDTDIDLTWE